MSEIEDRRQRAREAFWDTSGGLMSGARDGVEAAIETATRVQITREIEDAFLKGLPQHPTIGDFQRAFREGFRAAGFEVVE